ncbi:MAG: MXAN_6640 family putative metalloprotease [Myxococcales bacterium]
MMRAANPVVWLPALLATAAGVFAPNALGQTCESPRPTDPQGSNGVSYGSAEVDFFDAASGRTRIHFALSGPHAPPAPSTLQPGVPDAVVVAAQAADDALDEYEKLGYSAPLGDADSPCASNGDSDAIDVYLVNFAAADGQAVLDHCQPGLPQRCAGFVLVENDFRRGGYADAAEGLRTVVPHELFHLVQDAYDAGVERWWAEGSAQWAAKQVYPDLQDLERFLPSYFDVPWRPLNVPPNGVVTNFLYATAIWPVFLSERFDAGIVREVFEGFGPDPSDVLATTDVVLQAHGTSLADEYLQFAAYNAATGERAPDRGGYENAARYPQVPITSLTGSEGVLASDVGSGLCAFYYSLDTSMPTELTLEADAGRTKSVLIPVADGKLQLATAEPLPTTLSGQGVVVVAGQTLSGTDAPFSLRGSAPTPGTGNGGGSGGGSNNDGPSPSGCSLANPATNGGFDGLAALFGAILLSRCRVGSRRRKGL